MKDKAFIYQVLKRISPMWNMISPKIKSWKEINYEIHMLELTYERLKKLIKKEVKRYEQTKNEKEKT